MRKNPSDAVSIEEENMVGRKRSRIGKQRWSIMENELSGIGVNISSNATLKDVESIYRKKTKKPPPSYDKVSAWLHSTPIERIKKLIKGRK